MVYVATRPAVVANALSVPYGVANSAGYHLDPRMTPVDAAGRTPLPTKPRSPSAARPLPTESPDLELVWNANGARPRLLRKLLLHKAAPLPDFESASSRSLSTALRLGIKPHPISEGSTSAPQSSRTIKPPPVLAEIAREGAAPDELPKASRSIGHQRAWLAPEQQDFLDVLASKRRELSGTVSQRRREMSSVTASLTAAWQNPSARSRSSVKTMTMESPNVMLESILLDKLDKREAARMGMMQLGPGRRSTLDLGASW